MRMPSPLYPVGISTHPAELTRPAGEAVALTVVITAAAVQCQSA